DVLVLDDDFFAALPGLVLLEADRLLGVEADLPARLRSLELDLEVGALLEARLVGISRGERVLRERGRGDEEREAREADRPERLHAAMGGGVEATRNAASVFARTSSTVTPEASSTSSRPAPFGRTSKTQRSVMIRCTQRTPVNGSVQRFRIFFSPDFAVCSI